MNIHIIRYKVLAMSLIFIVIIIPMVVSIKQLDTNPNFIAYDQSIYIRFPSQGNYIVWHGLAIYLANVTSTKYIREYIENMCRSCGLYEYYYYRSRGRNIFVVIRVLLKNIGNSSIEIGNISFSIVTDKGIFNRYFLSYGDISYNLTTDDIKSSIEYKSLFIHRWLNRNEEALGDVLFQIPIDAKPLALRLFLFNDSLDIPLVYR